MDPEISTQALVDRVVAQLLPKLAPTLGANAGVVTPANTAYDQQPQDTRPSWQQALDGIEDGISPGALLVLGQDHTWSSPTSSLMKGLGMDMGAAGGWLNAIESPLNRIEIGPLPLGTIVIGGATGLIIGELVDQFFAPRTAAGGINYINLGVKAGAIFALGMFGRQLMSTGSVLLAAGIMGAQIIADVLPLSRLTDWILSLFGRTPATRYAHSAQNVSNGHRSTELTMHQDTAALSQWGVGRGHDLLAGVA